MSCSGGSPITEIAVVVATAAAHRSAPVHAVRFTQTQETVKHDLHFFPKAHAVSHLDETKAASTHHQ